MTRTSRDPAAAAPRWRRPFLLGFLLGAALIVPGVFVALTVPAAERVWRFLTPGPALLSPLSGVRATWPGALNLLISAVANGIVVGAAVAIIAVLLGHTRRRSA